MNYVPNTDTDVATMLNALGIESCEQLFRDVPEHVRAPRLHLPAPLAEMELVRLTGDLARQNRDVQNRPCFLGAGAYRHFVPSVVRHIVSRSEFYTAYTPYQPEISQGTLQAIFEYQSIICQLTGLDVANASMYDGATAAAEAAILAQNATRRKKVVVAPSVHPNYMSVITTYARESGTAIVSDWDTAGSLSTGRINPDAARQVVDSDTACLLVQHPNFFGCLEDVEELSRAAHEVGALFVVIVDPISLGLLKPPGSYDADVAVGEGQPLGNALNFGGPYLGIMAAREKYVRQMPGRIVGRTTDHRGQPGYVLTLQTREQHIRREKATSNICSNEALNALTALVYLAALGKRGLRRVAELCAQKAHYTADRITALPGFEIAYPTPFFKEFVVRTPVLAAEVNAELLSKDIIGGLDLGQFYPQLADCMLFCVTEMNTKAEIDKLVTALSGISQAIGHSTAQGGRQ